MLYQITDFKDDGVLEHRQHIEADNANEARIAAGPMPTLRRNAKPLPGCIIWGAMVVAVQ